MDASPKSNRDAQDRRAERHDCDGDNGVPRNLIGGGACKSSGHDHEQDGSHVPAQIIKSTRRGSNVGRCEKRANRILAADNAVSE